MAHEKAVEAACRSEHGPYWDSLDDSSRDVYNRRLRGDIAAFLKVWQPSHAAARDCWVGDTTEDTLQAAARITAAELLSEMA